MTPISRRLFLAMTGAVLPSAAFAHHGWGGYDTAKSFEVTGEILKSTYENPHCEIEVEVDGKLWHFVLAPPSRMQRRGITPEMIAAGSEVLRLFDIYKWEMTTQEKIKQFLCDLYTAMHKNA